MVELDSDKSERVLFVDSSLDCVKTEFDDWSRVGFDSVPCALSTIRKESLVLDTTNEWEAGKRLENSAEVAEGCMNTTCLPRSSSL